MTDRTKSNGAYVGRDGSEIYCASPRAVVAAATAYPGNHASLLADALIAAHDPALGLDRSVCLRDAVNVLRARADAYLSGTPTYLAYLAAANVLEREFGGAP